MPLFYGKPLRSAATEAARRTRRGRTARVVITRRGGSGVALWPPLVGAARMRPAADHHCPDPPATVEAPQPRLPTRTSRSPFPGPHAHLVRGGRQDVSGRVRPP